MNAPVKPHAPSCERNRDAILDALREHFGASRKVLEIGSGTGQHAVYFAEQLSHVTWQASDLEENLPGIRLWIDDAALPNLPPPIPLDVGRHWPEARYDAVFSANTLHIMGWAEVEQLFERLPAASEPRALLAVYGPFNYGGQFTSASNAKFNDWLQGRGTHMAIRDFEAVDELARAAGYTLREDRAMPANNRLLLWQQGD